MGLCRFEFTPKMQYLLAIHLKVQKTKNFRHSNLIKLPKILITT